MNKITVLGVGAFGFAMAKVVAENHNNKEIFVFDVQKEFIEHIKKTRRHPVFHKDAKLPAYVIATNNMQKAVENADLIILAIPSKFLRIAVKEFREYLTKDTVFLNLAKGLEDHTNMRVSEILKKELKGIKMKYEVCCLSG